MGVQNFKNLQFYMERNIYFHNKYRTPIILRHLHILNYRQRIKKSIYSQKLEINFFFKKHGLYGLLIIWQFKMRHKCNFTSIKYFLFFFHVRIAYSLTVYLRRLVSNYLKQLYILYLLYYYYSI